MAHLIDSKENGEARVFVVKEPAWHGLGKVLDNPATAEEAIKESGLGDFQVGLIPLKYDFNGESMDYPSKLATVRMDNGSPLGVVGSHYQVIQNVDCFKFFDNLISEKEAVYHSAGVLDGGRKMWILAKMPTDIVVGKDDLIKNYVMIYNSHDGSSGIVALMTPIRVVCNNTATAALHSAVNRVAIRHTKNAESKLKEAHRVLGLANIYRKEIEASFNLLAKKQINSDLEDSFLRSLLKPYENSFSEKALLKMKFTIKDIFNSEMGGQGLKSCKGTAYGLFNAATFYTDHVINYQSDNSRMNSIMFGDSATLRQRAFNSALALI